MLCVTSYESNSVVEDQWRGGGGVDRSSVALKLWGGLHVCSVTDGHLYLHFTDGQRRAPSRVSTRHGRSATRAKPCLHAALLTDVAPTARSCISRKDFNSPLHSILPPRHAPRVQYYPPITGRDQIRSDNRHKYRMPGPIFILESSYKVENSGKSNIFLDSM